VVGFDEDLYGLIQDRAQGHELLQQEDLHADRAVQLVIDAEYMAARIARRSDTCLPQAITAALAIVISKLEFCLQTGNHETLAQYAEIGMLIHGSSLLSTHKNEEKMIGDFRAAFRMLKDLRIGIKLKTAPFKGFAPVPEVAGDHASASGLTISIAVGSNEFTILNRFFPHGSFLTLHPALFNVGVNEMQTIARTMGSTAVERSINLEGLEVLKDYESRYSNRKGGHVSPYAAGRLTQALSLLTEEVSEAKPKQVSILMVGSQVTTMMDGGLWVSCKSAKDRTSMLCTLLCGQSLLERGVLENEEEVLLVANHLRGHGLRLVNCALNVGKSRYAFNQLQLAALPTELRPPKDVAGRNDS